MRVLKWSKEIVRPKDSRLLFKIVCFDCLVWFLLLWMKPQSVLKFLTPNKVKKVSDPERVQRIVRYTDFLLARNIPVIRGVCLKRSLILYYFLNREGIPAEINFGVARENSDFIGHSWITVDNKPLFENVDNVQRYRQTYRHSSPLKDMDKSRTHS